MTSQLQAALAAVESELTAKFRVVEERCRCVDSNGNASPDCTCDHGVRIKLRKAPNDEGIAAIATIRAALEKAEAPADPVREAVRKCAEMSRGLRLLFSHDSQTARALEVLEGDIRRAYPQYFTEGEDAE